jgi:DNA-binding NarL/FixJ family response regulator
MTSVVRVVVADDHPLMRAGIQSQLGAHDDIDVVATASAPHELVEVAAALQPDVILADIALDGGSLFDVLAALRAAAPAAKVVVLSASDSPAVVARAVEQGVEGFITKEADSADLATHVRAALAGRIVLDERASDALASGLSPATRRAALSARELEALRGVADGRTNREIALSMAVSASTVKTLLDRAFQKLGVRDRAAAVARAKDAGLL